jgi:hypothetical protein
MREGERHPAAVVVEVTVGHSNAASKGTPTLSHYARLSSLKSAARGLNRDLLVDVVLELVRLPPG